MKNLKENKKILIFLLSVSVILISMILITFFMLNSLSVFPNTKKSAVYESPEGVDAYYDPRYTNEEDVKKLMEEMGEHSE